MLTPLAYFAILALVCGYAFYRGSMDSRLAASICVVASIASTLVASARAVPYSQVESGIFIVDMAVLVGFSAKLGDWNWEASYQWGTNDIAIR